MIYYVDLTGGNDSTGDGSMVTPFLTTNKAHSMPLGPHDIRLKETAVSTAIGASATWTWIYNSGTVLVNADVTAVVNALDYIGKPTASGNGSFEQFYRVNSRSYSAGTGITTIILTTRYTDTTGNTTGALKQSAVTHGTGSTTISVSGTKVSGGWNFSTGLQTGQTWVKTSTTAFCVYSPQTNFTIDRINCIETYGILNTVSSNVTLTITNSSVFGGQYAYLMSNANGQVHIISNSTFCSYATEYALYFGNVLSAGSSLTNVKASAIIIGSGGALHFSGLVYKNAMTMSGVKVYFGGITLGYAGSSLDFGDTEIRNSTYGFKCGTTEGQTFIGGKMFNITYGVTGSGFITVSGTYLENVTYGAGGPSQYIRGRGDFSKLTFVNCQYNVYSDSYCGEFYVQECDFGVPINYACYSTGPTSTVFINNCTIASGSEPKTINVPSIRATTPRFVISDCNNSSFTDGSYWYFIYARLSYTTYGSSAPSLEITSSGAFNTNTNQEPMISIAPINKSTGRTITLKIKGGTGWSGSMTPVWKLNGMLIKEETPITSLNTTDFTTSYTWSIDSSLVTSNGLLELAMRPNPTGTSLSAFVDKLITVS
jgi:hypothetical protein